MLDLLLDVLLGLAIAGGVFCSAFLLVAVPAGVVREKHEMRRREREDRIRQLERELGIADPEEWLDEPEIMWGPAQVIHGHFGQRWVWDPNVGWKLKDRPRPD